MRRRALTRLPKNTLGIFSIINLRTDSGLRFWTGSLVAKTGFYAGFAAFCVFVLVSVILCENDRELKPIPSNRTSFEIIDAVEQYLRHRTHIELEDTSVHLNCWESFADKKFVAEYLLYGSWHVNAFRDRIRYYWRVDDKTLEVARDRWYRTRISTLNC